MHDNIARETIDYFVNESDTMLYRGVVIATHPETMTVDAFVYSTGTYLYDIAIGATATGEKQRVATMLEVDTPIIIAYTSEKVKPIALCSYTASDFETKSGAEKILDGETLISSKVGASDKIALDGSNYMISGAANVNVLDGDGKAYGNVMSAFNKSFGFESKKGIDLNNFDGLKSEYTFYQDIEKKYRFYSENEIDLAAENDIIDSAANILLSIDGDKDHISFYDEVGKLEEAYQKHSLDASKETVDEVEDYLEGFILKNTGTKVKLQFGKTEDEGIIFSLKILSEEGNTKGKITIDSDANMVIDMASCNIVR